MGLYEIMWMDLLKMVKNLSFSKKEVWTCGHKDPCLSISDWLLVSFSSVCVCVCVCVHTRTHTHTHTRCKEIQKAYWGTEISLLADLILPRPF